MSQPSRSPLALVGCALLGACSSEPETVPLSAMEQRDIEATATSERNLGKIENKATLFRVLEQNLRQWRKLSVDTSSDRDLRDSYEEALTRLVYNNFDTILLELTDGNPHNRPAAAAALGFSKIKAPDEPGGDPEKPQVHFAAIPALVAALEEGDDRLTCDALLGLALLRVKDPSIPMDLLLEMVATHHDPDVRANSALVLARLLDPQTGSSALSMLYAGLEDPEPKVRLHVVLAIGALQDPTAYGRLVDIYSNDESPLIRSSAAFALGKLGEFKAIPRLVDGLTSKHAVIRDTCHFALLMIAGEDLGTGPHEWMTWYNAQTGLIADPG